MMRSPFQRIYTRLVGICLVFGLVGQVQAQQTLLQYAGINWQDSSGFAVPVSVYHDQQGIDADARKILTGWQTDPVTLPWTQLMLERFIKHKISPNRAARATALIHVAMYDALEIAQAQHLNPHPMVSMAAAQVMAYLFPAEEKAFERIAIATVTIASGKPVNAMAAEDVMALADGEKVAAVVVQHAEDDGSARGWNGIRLQYYGQGRYYGPGTWEPTPPYYYYPPEEPFAPLWKPWLLKSASEFRPTPPMYGSKRFMHDLQEVVDINRTLTPVQLATAKFWVDGSGSVTPAGHWNRIAMDLVHQYRDSMDDEKTAELFAILGIAQADTFIAAWDAKYYYWTVRPVTAASQLLGITFTPAILTPPFPSYLSGHAAFSGVSARILGAYFYPEHDALDRMAEEAATSRMLGGIHYRYDNEDGLQLGRTVADAVLKRVPWAAEP